MSRISAVVWDYVERAGWTTGQAFISVLLAANASRTIDLPWKLALGVGLGAGLISLLTTFLAALTGLQSEDFWVDLGVRLAKTFLSTLLGAMASIQVLNIFAFDFGSALDLAFVATLTALGKGLLARGSGGDKALGAPVSASTLDDGTLLALRGE